jgi:hypothetical protein
MNLGCSPLAGKLDPKLDVVLVPRVIKTSIVGNHVPFLKIVPNQIVGTSNKRYLGTIL